MDIRTQVVEAAKEYIGTPYDKLDCSHFVQKALKQFGYDLKPNSANQAKTLYKLGLTTSISKSATVASIIKKLNTSDLIFWGNPKYDWRWNDIHHVGFYIGNGKTLESTGSGNGVHIGKVWESPGETAWQIVLIADVTSLLKAQEEDMFITIGSKGKHVVSWQWALIAVGCKGDMNPDLIDEKNEFGAKSAEATKLFQASVELPQTGEVDNLTAAKMWDKLSELVKTTEANYVGFQGKVSAYIGGIKTAVNMKI